MCLVAEADWLSFQRRVCAGLFLFAGLGRYRLDGSSAKTYYDDGQVQ